MSFSNSHYIDDFSFENDKEVFKNESWLLVAHKTELANNNDFISFEYFGEKIFIQNFSGTIKSFQNICLHRFNTIHAEACGNRVSSCLYHNWTYNKNGKVSGLSCRNAFDKSQINELALKEYEIDYCGDFVFLKINELNKILLKDYLGSIYNYLETFSRHFGQKTTDYNIEHLANWKLMVENVLECYHCSSVHENTFAKMGYGFAKPEKYDSFQGHSWCEFPKTEGSKENKLIEKIISSRTFKTDGYLHFYIYPNAFVSTVEGKGFYFGFLFPLSPSKTNLRVRYFAPILEKELTDSEQNIFDFINSSSNESLDVVLTEDRKVLESIQSNLNSVKSFSPIFGEEEFRINKFYDYFLTKIHKQ
jgi:phenylpropionate dioxygenase-like ring-hydroxylating dioxygenase large terminal subunit